MAEGNVSPSSVEAGYEVSDLRAKNIALSALIVAGTVFAVMVITYFLVPHFYKTERRERQGSSASVKSESIPEPKMWATPADEIDALRSEEEAILNSYGWADKKSGIARIPIDRAMDLIVEGEKATRAREQAGATGARR